MYDRLLKLLEEGGKKKPQQPELIANRPGTMLGGAGSGKAPASTPFYPRYTASLTRRSSRKKPAGDAIKSQRDEGSGGAMPSITRS